MTRVQIRPNLERNELTRLLGGRKTSRFSHSLQTKIRGLGVVAEKLIKPVIYYQRKGLEPQKGDSIRLEGGIAFRSPRISKVISTCEEIVCFIATIGDDIENETKKLLKENRLSEAYILDAMGSVAVENMVDRFHKGFITRTHMDGKGITLRFSPGYCDWPITDQKKLFDLFSSNHLRVELKDSCFMRPRKSITGVFGITSSNSHPPLYSYNPCSECGKGDCPMRRS